MRFLRWLTIAAIVALAIFHLKPQFADFKQFPTLLKNANIFFLFLSGISIVGQYIGDGWLSQVLLQMAGRKIKVRDAVKIASIDVFAAHLLPLGEVGTIATIAYFYKKIGVTNQEMIFLTVTWGIATNVVLVAFLMIAAALLPRLPNVPIHVSDISTFAIFAVVIISTIAIFFRKPLWKFAQNKLRKFSFFNEIVTFISNSKTHLENIKNNKDLVLYALIASLLYYMANIASLYFAFLAFGHAPSIATLTVAYLLSLVISFITLAPAGIGASEAVMILIIHQFGTDAALTLAGVLAFRLFAFWLPIPAGFLSYLSLKKYENEQ